MRHASGIGEDIEEDSLEAEADGAVIGLGGLGEGEGTGGGLAIASPDGEALHGDAEELWAVDIGDELAESSGVSGDVDEVRDFGAWDDGVHGIGIAEEEAGDDDGEGGGQTGCGDLDTEGLAGVAGGGVPVDATGVVALDAEAGTGVGKEAPWLAIGADAVDTDSKSPAFAGGDAGWIRGVEGIAPDGDSFPTGIRECMIEAQLAVLVQRIIQDGKGSQIRRGGRRHPVYHESGRDLAAEKGHSGHEEREGKKGMIHVLIFGGGFGY